MSDLPRSKAFCEKAFAPLGYVLGFGGEGVFWAFDLGDRLFESAQSSDEAPLTRVHVAFRVKSKGEVDAFHRAALRPARWITERPARARRIPKPITPASYSTPMATTSRR